MSLIPILNISGNNIDRNTFPTISSDDDKNSALPEWPEEFARQALEMHGFSPAMEDAILESLNINNKCECFLAISTKVTNIMQNLPLPPGTLLHMRAYILFANKLLSSVYPTRGATFDKIAETLAEWIHLFHEIIETYFSRNQYGMRTFLYDYAREVRPMITATYKRPIWNGI